MSSSRIGRSVARVALSLCCTVTPLLLAIAPSHPAEIPPICDYTVKLQDANAHSVEVAVTCRHPVSGFYFADYFPLKWVTSFTDSDGGRLSSDERAWGPKEGSIKGARYQLNLDGMAKTEDLDTWAKRFRGSVIVRLSGLIAIPFGDESYASEELAIRFVAPNGGDVAIVPAGSARNRSGSNWLLCWTRAPKR
jgi:hypothetical protein